MFWKIVIYGVGVIGCEYVFIFCGLGVWVELINICDCLFDFLDYEILDSLSYYLWDIGVLICNGEEYEDVIGWESDVVVKLKLGKIVCGDIFLWCNGCIGNIDLLNLDVIGFLVNYCG